MHRIMIVDDDENILSALKRVLGKAGDWEIVTCNDPLEALEKAQETLFHLFLSDYRMPGMNGVEFLLKIKKLYPESMRLILSGQADFKALITAINDAEIYRFISKPADSIDLISSITAALQFFDLITENKQLADQVRNQQRELNRRENALKKLAKEHPVIAQVNWDADGYIVLDENML